MSNTKISFCVVEDYLSGDGYHDVAHLNGVTFTQDIGPFKSGDKFENGILVVDMYDNSLCIEMWDGEYSQLQEESRYVTYTKIPAI